MNRTELVPLDADNLSEFKLLHDCIFPTKFPAAFFREAASPKKPGIYQLAVDSETKKSVGVLAAQIQPLEDHFQLYIFSLGCRFSHRRRKIGTLLLSCALDFIQNQAFNCQRISLHVQAGNEDALEFYTKHGFVEFQRIPNYYRRHSPSEAILMIKTL